jgi:hypothetical protein
LVGEDVGALVGASVFAWQLLLNHLHGVLADLPLRHFVLLPSCSHSGASVGAFVGTTTHCLLAFAHVHPASLLHFFAFVTCVQSVANTAGLIEATIARKALKM